MLLPEQKQKLVNAGYSASKIAAYERSKGLGSPTPQSGFGAALRDIPSDIGETVQNVGQAAAQGFFNKPLEARAQVERGEISGGAGFLKSLGAGAAGASRAIGEGILGVGKLFTSPKTEENIGQFVGEKVGQVAQTQPVQDLIARYQALTPEQKALVQGAGGLAEGAATALGFGPGVRAAGTVVKKTGQVAATGVKTAVPAVGTVAKLPIRGYAEAQGALTGTSEETISQAFNAARRGGKELEEFTKALRNKTTPEELVVRMREGVETVNAQKSANYSKKLAEIGDTVVDTKGIVPEVQANLKSLGIKINEEGVLDFSNSKFSTVPSAGNKLQTMYDKVVGLGDQRSLRDIDTLRQALKNLELAGDDNAARTANFAITNATNKVREAGKQVEGYGKMLSEFVDDAQFLDEVTEALSSGDKATIDTAYRKMATALKTNNEQRRNLLMELDEVTGGYVLSSVAGQQLSEALPRGLSRYMVGIFAGTALGTGGASLLPALVFASPRVVGEVLRAAGIAQGKVDKLINAFTKAKKEIGLPAGGTIQSGVRESVPSSNGSTLLDKAKGAFNTVRQEGKRGFVSINPRVAELRRTLAGIEKQINNTADKNAKIRLAKARDDIKRKIREIE